VPGIPITTRSLWSPFPVCGDKQGRAGQGRTYILSNKNTIFFKNYFHYRTYLKN